MLWDKSVSFQVVGYDSNHIDVVILNVVFQIGGLQVSMNFRRGPVVKIPGSFSSS